MNSIKAAKAFHADYQISSLLLHLERLRRNVPVSLAYQVHRHIAAR